MKHWYVIYGLISGLQILLNYSSVQSQSIAIPDGYAGYAGTTGGGDATPVTVNTASEFISAVNGDDPAVIIVAGRLETGTVEIGSNKTIAGADSAAGLYGGVIRLNKSNYIIQNLLIGPNEKDDAMEVTGATKVFIHKCEFFDGADGNLDIVRASDYVTVSWCKFYYVNQTGHKNTILIGNGDEVTSDAGKLHVTLHHNWFAEGCNSRMPRVRYGHVHIYNNYYSCAGNNYCIGTGYQCRIRVENTYFDNISDPWDSFDALRSGGVMGWDNLIFVACSQPAYIRNSYPVFPLPYGFGMNPAENVKTVVRAGAGNVFDVAGQNLPAVSITAPPDTSEFTTNSSITIEADASVTGDTITSVKFYSDSLLYEDQSEPFSFTWDNVGAGIYSLSAVATDNHGNTAISKTITVFAGSGVAISSPISGSTYEVPVNVTVDAIAWDDDGSISSVEFFRGITSLGTDSSPPYSITWKDNIPGTYNLTARATDNDHNITVSEEVGILVTGGPEGYEFCSTEGEDCIFEGLFNVAYGAGEEYNYKYNVTGSVECSSEVLGDPISGTAKACYVQPAVTPYVVITSPEYGANFSVPVDITFTVFAIDNDGTIDSVRFYRNNNLIGVSTVDPFSFTWYNVAAGTHVITARATDNDGNSSASTVILIKVRDATGIVNQDTWDAVLYPNPVSGELNLKLNDRHSPDTYFTLYNSSGKTVMKGNLSGGEQILNLKALPGGIYLITISGREVSIIRKIIKN